MSHGSAFCRLHQMNQDSRDHQCETHSDQGWSRVAEVRITTVKPNSNKVGCFSQGRVITKGVAAILDVGKRAD